MASCPKCSADGYAPGTRCAACGRLEGEPEVKPDPEGGAPGDSAVEYVCRYCDTSFGSAADCREHQGRAHKGVGTQKVTDLISDLPLPLRGLRRRR